MLSGSFVKEICVYGQVTPHETLLGCEWQLPTASLGIPLQLQAKWKYAFHANDFSKFLLIFFFFLQLDPLMKSKESEDEQVNYTFF